jgi:hypothetical protein
MATTVSPEKHRHRSFFTYGLPILFAGCVGAASWVLAVNRDALLATPLIIVAFCITRLMRWSMVWASTPEEQKLFARGMDHEPVLSLVRDWINRNRAKDDETKPPDSVG